MRTMSVGRVFGLAAALLVASVGTIGAQSQQVEPGLYAEMISAQTTQYRLILHHPTDISQVADDDRDAVRSVIGKIACASMNEVQSFRQDLARSNDYTGDMAVVRNWMNRSVLCEARTSARVESVEMRMNTDMPAYADLLTWRGRTTAQLEVNVDPVIRGGFTSLAHLQSTLDDRSTARCMSALVNQGKITEAQKNEYLQNIRSGKGQIVALPKYIVANYGCGKADGRNIIYEPPANTRPMQAYLQQLSSGVWVFTKESCTNLGLPLQHWEAVATRLVEAEAPRASQPPPPRPRGPGVPCFRSPGETFFCALLAGAVVWGISTLGGDDDQPKKETGSPPVRVSRQPGISIPLPWGGRSP